MQFSKSSLSDRDALIEANRDYATALAREVSKGLPRSVKFADLLGDAMLGLVEAADRYDPSKGATFRSYAYYRIRGAMWDGIRKATWLPPDIRRQAREESVYCRSASLEPTPVDLDDPQSRTHAFRAIVRRAGRVITNSDLGSRHDDRIVEPSVFDEAECVEERRERIAALDRAINRLPQADQELVHVMVRGGASQTEVAKQRGKHKSTIGRDWKRIVVRIREEIGAHHD